MNSSLLALFLLGLTLFSDVAAAEPAESLPEIRWVIAPYPPFHITEGDLAGHGIIDQVVSSMQAQLPGFRHTNTVMTDSRAWQELKDLPLVCHPAALKTPEREQFAVFSEAGAIVPSMVFIMRQDVKRGLFGERQMASLAEVVNHPTLRIGMISERAYGDIDGPLHSLQRSSRLVQVSNQYGPLSLLRMLKAGRVDVMIEYPWILRYMASTDGSDAAEVMATMGIEELEPFLKSQVACSATDDGRRVVQQLNGWIRSQLPLESNRRIVGDWLDPDTLLRYRAAYEQLLAPVVDTSAAGLAD